MTTVVDNYPVMEGMNGGFGSWSLSFVLTGKIRANNLAIIYHATASFSIKDSFTVAPGSQINLSIRVCLLLTSQWNTGPKTTVCIVRVARQPSQHCKWMSFLML